MPLSTSCINWYQPKDRDALAVKVTTGLALHWPCISGLVVYPLTGLMAKDRAMRIEHPVYAVDGA